METLLLVEEEEREGGGQSIKEARLRKQPTLAYGVLPFETETFGIAPMGNVWGKKERSWRSSLSVAAQRLRTQRGSDRLTQKGLESIRTI